MKSKSPSKIKRDSQRMYLFNKKKREEQFAKEKQILETKVEALQTELMSKLDETEQLRQRISDASYKSLPAVNPYVVQPTTYHAPEPSTSYHPLVMEDVYTDEEQGLRSSFAS